MKYPIKPIEYTYTKLPWRQRIRAWCKVNEIGGIIAVFIVLGLMLSSLVLFYLLPYLYI
jgi:hypothetical protein